MTEDLKKMLEESLKNAKKEMAIDFRFGFAQFITHNKLFSNRET